MLKIIFKHIVIVILVYPLALFAVFLDKSWSEYSWLITLILLILIGSVLCFLEIKERNNISNKK